MRSEIYTNRRAEGINNAPETNALLMLDELTPRTELLPSHWNRQRLCVWLWQSCRAANSSGAPLPQYPSCPTCLSLLDLCALISCAFQARPSVCPALPCLASQPQVVTILGAGVEHSILHWTLNRPPHILSHPCLAWWFVYFLHCRTKFSEHTQAEHLLPPHTQIHTHSVGYTSIINQYSSIFVRRSLPLDWSALRV